jgi:DNA-binding LytR/AlgR family response regulator
VSRLRAVVVDNEPPAVRRLEIALGDVPEIEVVGSALGGRKAVELIAAVKPDVLFLDIEMPVMNGFELLQALKDAEAPIVVFVTAFSRFAPAAFAVGAADYLLKPVEFDRLAQAVERAARTLRARSAEARMAELEAVIDQLRNLDAERAGRPEERDLWVTTRAGYVRVPISQVEWFEAERDYVQVHTADRSYLMHASLRALGERLAPAGFLRTHRSALVNRASIARLDRSGGMLTIITVSGARAPVSRSQAAGLRAMVKGGDELEA